LAVFIYLIGRYSYITYDDICEAYPDLTVLIAKPHEDMIVEAPEPMYVSIDFVVFILVLIK
jgi:hypothetical protein